MEQIFRRNSALDLIDKWKQVLAESTNEYYVMILRILRLQEEIMEQFRRQNSSLDFIEE